MERGEEDLVEEGCYEGGCGGECAEVDTGFGVEDGEGEGGGGEGGEECGWDGGEGEGGAG